MGYLTTITFYNDGAHLIPENKEDVADAVYECITNHSQTTKGIAGFCNFINSQKPRHADDHTIYVHMGNCVTEVNPYSQEFKKLCQSHPDFANKLVAFLKSELRELNSLLKEMDNEV